MASSPSIEEEGDTRVLHIGDFICLFCKETKEGGFVFSDLSRSFRGRIQNCTEISVKPPTACFLMGAQIKHSLMSEISKV